MKVGDTVLIVNPLSEFFGEVGEIDKVYEDGDFCARVGSWLHPKGWHTCKAWAFDVL